MTKKEMSQYRRRREKIAAMLKRGDSQSDVARHFKMTRQRVSQVAALIASRSTAK